MSGNQDRPVFARPIEIDSTNSGIQITHDDGGGDDDYVITLSNGVYGCVNSALWKLNDQIQKTALAGGGTFATLNFEITIDTDCKVNIACDEAIDVTFLDADMAAWMGFTANVSNSTSATATYTPSHIWLPTFTFLDQGQWRIEQDRRFMGAMSNSGRLAGTSVSDRKYRRDLSFTAEPNTNCMIAFEDSDYSFGGNTYQPKADRCFEYFMEQCRTSVSSGTNQYSKGVYLWHSLTDFRTLTQTLGDGGIQTGLSSSPDTYVFCSPEPQGAEVGDAFFPVGRDRYNIPGVTLTTATAPTWDV